MTKVAFGTGAVWPTSSIQPGVEERRVMLGQVTIAHSITHDHDLQALLREVVGSPIGGDFAVQLPSSNSWNVVSAPGKFAMQRDRPPNMPTLTPIDFYDAPPARQRAIKEAASRTRANEIARSCVEPLFGTGSIIRREAEGWPTWSVLLERTALSGCVQDAARH